ncbi:PEP-CTERM sorting domain-containing protein [Pikeienuella piscinae]|uniref:PEP-CTERM sorting domain-containing protein n=1 Tax=Pikeienuella piscinae TaxID=2748098 RepID=A0A7M3T656_9RHOB|nr:PEP-CTERM sorting domain-containing protein [Pikeienuella piscinae]QIE57487.1 PEP-CTERM sorting domain-containing protein [Pikeienuella piscinae]
MNSVQSSVGAVALAVLFGFAAAPAQALVVNGGFEDTTSSTPGVGLVNQNTLGSLASGSGSRSWDVFTSLNGWTTTAGSGIEVQTNNTLGSIDARTGQHYVELDSHPAPNSNSTMAQDLVLDSGRYNLEFYYSPRNGDVGSNGIGFSVIDGLSNSLLLGEVTGPDANSSTSVGLWTLITASFTVASDNTPITLGFSATGTANTLGGLIDDISVSAVPVPAALPLFLTAIAGLGFASRRRRAT